LGESDKSKHKSMSYAFDSTQQQSNRRGDHRARDNDPDRAAGTLHQTLRARLPGTTARQVCVVVTIPVH